MIGIIDSVPSNFLGPSDRHLIPRHNQSCGKLDSDFSKLYIWTVQLVEPTKKKLDLLPTCQNKLRSLSSKLNTKDRYPL